MAEHSVLLVCITLINARTHEVSEMVFLDGSGNISSWLSSFSY